MRVTTNRRRASGGLLVLWALAASGPALAQGAGCRTTNYTDPPREVLTCADGLTISAEKDAVYRLVDRNRDGTPEAVELERKAILIEVSPRRRGGFQVLTPNAVASVRGTVWAVDLNAAGTAVFVQSGRVGVARAAGPGAEVVLATGEGVDVGPGTDPLAVKTWPRERALHLLARFGR